jgi:hypothetical protein
VRDGVVYCESRVRWNGMGWDEVGGGLGWDGVG